MTDPFAALEAQSDQPKHRRCTRERHHVWTYTGPTGTGWTIATCTMCGKKDLA